MTPKAAETFVRTHGVVLASAQGPVPSVAEQIAKGPIRGSWWGHPKGQQIFSVLQHLGEAPDILFCRLVGGKVSLVHRRLWPALVRVAANYPPAWVSRILEVHTADGHHRTEEIAFPGWVTPALAARSKVLTEADAFATLGDWALPKKPATPRRPRR